MVILNLSPEDDDPRRVEVIVRRWRERLLRLSGLPLPLQAQRNVGDRFRPGVLHTL